jgi:hypothetical protein
MRRPRLLVLASAVLAATGSLVLGPAAPSPAVPSQAVPWCADALETYPCILAASRAGTSLLGAAHWGLDVSTYARPAIRAST